MYGRFVFHCHGLEITTMPLNTLLAITFGPQLGEHLQTMCIGNISQFYQHRWHVGQQVYIKMI